MPSNHLILCCPLLLLSSIFPSIRVFSNESGLCIRWLKYWSFSFHISPSSEHSGLISFRMDLIHLKLTPPAQPPPPSPCLVGCVTLPPSGFQWLTSYLLLIPRLTCCSPYSALGEVSSGGRVDKCNEKMSHLTSRSLSHVIPDLLSWFPRHCSLLPAPIILYVEIPLTWPLPFSLLRFPPEWPICSPSLPSSTSISSHD